MSENDSVFSARFDSGLIGDPNFLSAHSHKPHDLFKMPLEYSEYKIPFAPTMESLVRKLRLTMETYRELLIHANNLILWEQPWHPYAIAGGCTMLFMLLWLCEPNILTILSILGLLITVSDYILPAAVNSIYKNETWTPEKQNQYEEICANIILYKTKLELLFTSYYRMRVTNPKLYFSLTIFGLSFFAWIGGTVNNLFLMYVFVLVSLLLPGMIRNGMLNKASETLSRLFTELVENAKSKVGQKKIQ